MNQTIVKSGQRFIVGQLFEKYKVDPALPDREMGLVWRLAAAHVPGCQVVATPPPWAGSRLDLLDVANMFDAFVTIRQHLIDQGRATSERAVSARLKNPRERKRVLSPSLDRAVGKVLSQGNKRYDGWGNPRTDRSDTWIRNLDRELLTALSACREETASPLQIGFVEVVLPVYHDWLENPV